MAWAALSITSAGRFLPFGPLGIRLQPVAWRQAHHNRRRKSREASMANQRGLVISVPVELAGTGFRAGGGLDQQELRFSLLFWDKLHAPRNNFLLLGDQTADFLESAGILQQPITRINFTSGIINPGEIVISSHLNAYRALDQAEPGVWSLGAGRNSVSFPERDLEAGRGILVRLYEAIPVPDKEVPLQDILEFKEKRQDELLALRYHLDSIYQRIVTAGDGELSLQSEIDALERAIVDYLKVAKGTSFSFINTSFAASLNVPTAVAAGLAAFTTGFDTVPALLAGAAAGIAFGPSASLKDHKTNQTPFRYISSFHKRVF
jgi:hypothetical protein